MMERIKQEEPIETNTEKLLDDAPSGIIENDLHQILMNVAEEK